MQWTLSVAIWLQKFNGCKPVAMWSQICNRLDRLKFGRKFAVTEGVFFPSAFLQRKGKMKFLGRKEVFGKKMKSNVYVCVYIIFMAHVEIKFVDG